ncbi:hypothetical protein N0V87_001158 [Didymella glomerata]|uniref:Uncharacterized protein n=1 Tax=Didymella glomerata TaxID=749621 RepID=A0A9W8X648_9PLEO|nr:hypothetical protein N0V87_001158 [Didymella glomerata]
MDPAFGASETWLQRVRDSFPQPIESESEVDKLKEEEEEVQTKVVDDASSSSTRPITVCKEVGDLGQAKDLRCLVEKATTAIKRAVVDISQVSG